MPKQVNLVKVGTKVSVKLESIKDRIPYNLFSLLTENSSAVVVGYRMTDGNGIGVILELFDGSQSWFFGDELEYIETEDPKNQLTRDTLVSNSVVKRSKSKDLIFRNQQSPVLKTRPLDLINPFVFQKWLFYSLKDVI